MGINPTSPGYTRFTVKPQPGPVEAASIALPTHAGMIRASFTQVPGKAFTLDLTPPANTLARVYVQPLHAAARAPLFNTMGDNSTLCA